MTPIGYPVPARIEGTARGGSEGCRTPYLLAASEALSQLSYEPIRHSNSQTCDMPTLYRSRRRRTHIRIPGTVYLTVWLSMSLD